MKIISRVIAILLMFSLMFSIVISASADTETNSTTATSETEELHSKVDNSKYKWFPPIGQQYGNSCSAWASTYYMFTYEMARRYDYDAKNDLEFIASPKQVWNSLNSGNSNAGSDLSECLNFLDKYGWVSWDDFPQSDDSVDWYDNIQNSSLMYDSLKACVVNGGNICFYPDPKESTPITSADDEDLYEFKKKLSDGYIMYLSSVNPQLFQKGALSNNEKVITHTLSKMEGISSSRHALVVVGYDDTIYYDLNEDGEQQPYEYGALLLANSYGKGWENNGFIWIMYDALNKVSNADNLNVENRCVINNLSRCSYFDLQKQPVDLAVEVTISQKVRNDFNLYVGSSLTLPLEENPPAANQKETINQHGGALNFDGTTSDTYQTRKFMIDCSELYQQNKLILPQCPLTYVILPKRGQPKPATIILFG